MIAARVARRPISVLSLCVAIPAASLPAQFEGPPPPAAYALAGVTLVGADGARRPGTTIVVRGRLIEALGPGVEVPPDALRLEGDSLFVYPGMVDAQGTAAFEFPKRDVNQQEIEPWAPPRDAQGFLPHRRVVEHLTATGSSLAEQRRQGIVAAAVHPHDPVLPGQGTLLLLRRAAAASRELVIRPVLGPVFSFDGARGVYPATRFGVSAFLRQRLEDARHEGLVLAAHARDPRGLSAPSWDPDLAVLRSVMAGELPVFFEADRAEDIREALDLAAEYGFRPLIVGGGQAWRVADLLRERRVPVLVSVDFPEPKRWKPKAARREEPDSTEAAPPAQEPQPLDAGAQREKDELERRYANAGRLAQAGVRFALTSGGGKAKLRDGARKAIEYGLGEDAALAAVTSVPAELLGAPYLARVEPGMPATFVVADGPLFAEDTKIVYTFVEGALEKGASTREGAEAPAVDLTGAWEMEIAFGGGSVAVRVTLRQEGAAFSGSGESEFGPFRIKDGTVSGNRVDFVVEVAAGGQTITADYTGTVEGNRASGSGSGPQGSVTWTATRRPGSEG